MSENIQILETAVLSDNWYVLRKYTYRQRAKDGNWEQFQREVYDRGNGAAILLYNREKKSVVLTKQFRLPTFVNGNPDGMLIEACAGLLDGEHPLEAILRETEEETGYKIRQAEKVFEVYMSPGSVTEILHLYIAEYDASMKSGEGGGVDAGEDIEVLELSFDDAWTMVSDGRVRDAKTIMLLQHAKLRGMLRDSSASSPITST